MSGVIEAYIHTSNCIGVLVEVGCENDWIAQSPKLKALAKDIAMQIAACPNVKHVKMTGISTDVIQQQQAIERSREDIKRHPLNIQKQIVQGRVETQLKQMCLLDQPYIRDQSITVEELINFHIAELLENIEVRRFVRFVVDESANPPPPISGSGVPVSPLPNPPDPTVFEEQLE